MIICFNATNETKKALDALMKTAEFQDVSEAISMALINYEVLHRANYHGARVYHHDEPVNGKPVHDLKLSSKTKNIPEIFLLRKDASFNEASVMTAEYASSMDQGDIGPKRWLFGQYNRFLPVKASCRALLNILREVPGSIPVNDAASKISFAACDLGNYLRNVDARLSLKRDTALSAAFPSTSYHGAESRLRFGGQFVASLKQGVLTGFPASLKLLNHDGSKNPKLVLTKAGIAFALLPNPLIDGLESDGKFLTKWTEEEKRFLLTHIKQFVPHELAAYSAIIDGIRSGSDNPDKLDDFLCNRYGLKIVELAASEDQITRTFLVTQRTGAISRMADLDLIGKEKSGLRVTYYITKAGQSLREASTT